MARDSTLVLLKSQLTHRRRKDPIVSQIPPAKLPAETCREPVISLGSWSLQRACGDGGEKTLKKRKPLPRAPPSVRQEQCGFSKCPQLRITQAGLERRSCFVSTSNKPFSPYHAFSFLSYIVVRRLEDVESHPLSRQSEAALPFPCKWGPVRLLLESGATLSQQRKPHGRRVCTGMPFYIFYIFTYLDAEPHVSQAGHELSV
jgi:hypothetical protein